MLLKYSLLLLILVMAVPSVRSQDRASSTTQPITLFVTVRDKHGKVVSSLMKDDFALTQDDRPQTIQSLAGQIDSPLRVGLLFETTIGEAGALDRERSASHDFLDQTLREDKDKAFIIHFDHEVELLRDLTNSRDRLFNGLGLLQTAGPGQSSEDSDESVFRASGAVLYDAIYLASNEVMKTQHDRKVLIVISGGVDQGSKETVGSAIESAQRTGSLVYPVFSKTEEPKPQGRGFGFPGRRGSSGPPNREMPHPDGRKVLEQISRETGGAFFEVSKKQSVAEIYKMIEEDLRNQYSLVYAPDQATNWKGFHKIVITTKDKDLIVQAPQGFYAGD